MRKAPKQYVQENPKKDPRVVWQRHEVMVQEDTRTSNTAMANNEVEVIVTPGLPIFAQGWHQGDVGHCHPLLGLCAQGQDSD